MVMVSVSMIYLFVLFIPRKVKKIDQNVVNNSKDKLNHA